MAQLLSIKLDEGFSQTVYTDTTGNRTVCWGHKVLPQDESLIASDDTVSMETCDLFFNNDYNIATNGANELVSDFYSQPDVVQDILINMCFNLGKEGLGEFVTFLSLIEECKYKEAADDLTTTLWYKQTGERARNIVEVLEDIQ